MKLEDFFVMIGLKLLVMGQYLKNTLGYTTPLPLTILKKSVHAQALIYLSIAVIPFIY